MIASTSGAIVIAIMAYGGRPGGSGVSGASRCWLTCERRGTRPEYGAVLDPDPHGHAIGNPAFPTKMVTRSGLGYPADSSLRLRPYVQCGGSSERSTDSANMDTDEYEVSRTPPQREFWSTALRRRRS